jgi:DNA-binding NarL/FixJ family response regulator
MSSKDLLIHAAMHSGSKIRIVIVDDHPLFRHGIKQLINAEEDMTVCGEAANAQQALSVLREMTPDFAIVDIGLKGTNGIELMKSIKAEHPKLPVLIVSMHDESMYALRALRAGARGYVMKQEALDQVMIAMREVLAGKTYLSPGMADRVIFQYVQGETATDESLAERLTDRELEVLQLIGKGKSTREIAAELHLSIKTVESHRLRIKQKLNVSTSQEMVRFATDWVNQQAI